MIINHHSMWKFIIAAFLAFMTLFFFATPFVFFLDPITVGILVVIGAFIIKGKVFSDSDVNSTSSASKRTEEINSQTKKEQSTASQIEENKKVSNRQPKVDFKSGINYGMLTDIDGNIYKTVQIGNQIWMAENLRVSRYRNGDLIPNVTDNEKWGEFETGAWCNYDNNPNLNSEYGKLYNWYAVDDVRGLAPEGWHTPSDDEWQQLIEYLGGVDGAGGKLKEAGTNHWKEPNEGGTNENSFSALPGGIRYREGAFVDHGYYGHWWSASANDTSYCYMTFVKTTVGSGNGDKYSGFSVRCLRD